jgi:hypothetical protein
VTSIKRDSTRDQRPIGLSEPIVDSTVVNGVAVDATWSDALTVAVLTLDGDVSSVTAVEVGGDISPLGDLERSVTIVGGNGESNLRVLGADGTVIERNGTGWSDTGVPVLFLASQR